MNQRHALGGAMAGLAAGLLVAGCAVNENAPASPNFDIVRTSSTENISICKIGPVGTSATFSITHTGTGTLPSGSTFTLPATPLCEFGVSYAVAWEIGSDRSEDTVTITETEGTPGMELQLIATPGGLEGLQYVYPPQNWITLRASAATAGIPVWFKNEGTPANDNNGCTPGYWKQSQHSDSWPSPYTPSTAFGSVFANAFPGKTLLQVLGLGGGGLNALGRHAVAALLSSASSGVEYPLSTADVISDFNAAFASGNYEPAKNVFAGFNEQSCPLN